MVVEIFSKSNCKLGEGGDWNFTTNSFFWVDILDKKLFEKKDSIKTRFWDLDFTPSAVFEYRDKCDFVWILSNRGLVLFNLLIGNYEVKTPLIENTNEIRTNDAGIDPFGNLVFSYMYKDPSIGNGEIYRLNKDNSIDLLLQNINIPNTFVWDKSGKTIFFADSYKKTIYKSNYSKNKNKLNPIAFYKLPTTCKGEPDGSVMGEDEIIWNACWNDSSIHLIDKNGCLMKKISLPVVKPTSCSFGPKGDLYITTASIDCEDSISKYNGHVLKLVSDKNCTNPSKYYFNR